MWKTLSLSIGVLALLVTSQASGSITYDYYVNGVVANGLGFQAVISDNSDNPSIATNEVQITLTNKRSVTASVYGQYFNIASSWERAEIRLQFRAGNDPQCELGSA